MARAPDQEIERKYLLRGLPDRVAGAPVLEIDQGYLPGKRINERIRRTRSDAGVRFYRTLKAGSGLVRLEIEEETTEAFFMAVWPLTRGARVAKRRYLVPDADVTWEIDEFVDRSGLWLAEVELRDAEQVAPVPAWLAAFVVREVTTDRAFTNHALAK
jgi:CYTH domain-containing protein